MTTETDVTNRSLQLLGTRTTVASLSEQSNEAIQANLIIHQLRDDLLRMAPWNCSFNFATLTLITAAPGTPENTAAATTTWVKGQPAPPWAYEYQYPADCLRAQVIVPQFTTGFASGIPITTAVTGGAPQWWTGPPVKFKVGIDQFYGVTAVSLISAGTLYSAGDLVTLAGQNVNGAPTLNGVTGNGAGPVIQVLTADPVTGAILTFSLVSQIAGESPAIGGSLFKPVPNSAGLLINQASTTGSGTGATFNITQNQTASDQRVIMTNQEFAILGYCRQITDPNVMDPLFLDAWTNILAARLAMVLTGDKAQANMQIQVANNMVVEARKADGNESLTINDVTPDWIRTRGINLSDWAISPNQGWDWGSLFPMYS